MSDYSISAKITADASGFQTAITKATSALDNFGKDFSNSTKEISTGLKKWGVDFDAFYNKGSSIFKSFGVDIDQFASNFGMSGKLMSGIVAVTTALNKLGEEVNKVTVELVKGTGATGTALSQLENTAKDAMLKGIGDSAEDVGKIIANLNTRFGVTGEKAVQLARSFDSLSEVMGVDASESVNSVADALKKWGLGAQDANIFLDKLTVASQQTGASFSELLSGLTSGQAIFSQFGMTINDSIAFLGGLSSEGLNTESAITGLRTALNNFAKDGENAADGLERVTDEIRNAKNQTEAMRIATETFGSRAGAEMLKVIQSESSAIADLTEKLKDASGALAKTDEASRTAKDAWKDLKISLEAVFGSFGQGVNDMIRDIIDSFRNLVELITPIIQPIAETFRWVFSTVGYVVKTATSSLLDFFDTETEVERIGKLTNQAYEEQAEAVATLRQEVRKLDEAEREREKNALTRQMAGEASIIKYTQEDIKNLTAEYNRLQAKLQEVNENEYELGQIADKYRDVETQLQNLNAVLELHQTKYSGYAEQLKVFTDIEEEEADTRIQTAKREAEQKELAQKEAYLKMADYIESFGDKEIAQNIKIAQQKMQNEIQTLKNIEAGEAQIAAVRQKYTAEINGYLIDQINNEEKAELAKVEALEKIIGATKETEELRKTITQYYANERKQIETENVEAVIKVIEEEKKAFAKAEQEKIELLEETSEKALEVKEQSYTWDIRLLEQQKAAAQTDKERNEIQKQIYELQRKQALASADINDYAKINEYYDNLIADLTEERADAMGKVAEAEEQARQSAEKSAEAKATNYSWDLKLLQLDLEEATRAKEKERIQKEIYEMQRDEALARADIADHAKINEYYDRLIKGLIQDQNEALEEQAELYEDVDNSRNGGEKSATPNKEAEERAAAMQKLAEMEQSWNDKLLSQKIALAESERQLDSDTYEAQAYHIDRILKLKQEQLENEKQAALANVEDTEENASLRASIEKYYDNESAQMYRDSLVEKEKYREKDVKEERSLWDKSLEYAKKAVSAMKSIVSGISNVIGTAISGAINIVGKLWSGFVSMLDFNPDDALMGLLEFEDKILSFFYNVLPKIPAFIASAFQSISVLLDTVFDSVDFGGMFDAIAGAVAGIFSKLPSMIKKSLPKLMSAIKTLLKSFKNILPDLLRAGMELVKMLFNELPRFIQAELPSLVQAIIGVIPQLMGEGSQLVTGIAQALPMLLDGVLKAFIAILQNPSQIGDLISALTQAIVALIKTVLTNLPQLISGLVDLLTEVLKAIPDIIIGLLTDPEVWKSVARSFVNILLAPINMAIGLLNKIPFVNIPKLDASNWFADGTNSAPRGLAVVGESGPELVDFRGGEKVYNNTNTEKMLAGAKSGNTFNVTFNNTVDTSAYQMMRQLKQYNREMAFNGVL